MTRHLVRPATTLLAALGAALLLSCGSGDGPSADESYKITLRYCAEARFSTCGADPSTQATLTEITQAQRDAFQAAATRVEGLITAGLVPAVTRSGGSPLQCGDDSDLHVSMNEEVHGLLVLVTLKSGMNGGTIASSGPCIERASSKLPLVAMMQFNSVTVENYRSNGQLPLIATHEMLHCLGFGTIWDPEMGLGLITGEGTTNPRFTGARALATAKSTNGAPSTWTSLPLDNTGGVGTLNSHWRQPEFGQEMMTGYIPTSPTTPFPLSATTLASLRDLGYSVNMSRAESFTLDVSGVSALRSSDDIHLSDDVLRIPVRSADDGVQP